MKLISFRQLERKGLSCGRSLANRPPSSRLQLGCRPQQGALIGAWNDIRLLWACFGRSLWRSSRCVVGPWRLRTIGDWSKRSVMRWLAGNRKAKPVARFGSGFSNSGSRDGDRGPTRSRVPSSGTDGGLRAPGAQTSCGRGVGSSLKRRWWSGTRTVGCRHLLSAKHRAAVHPRSNSGRRRTGDRNTFTALVSGNTVKNDLVPLFGIFWGERRPLPLLGVAGTWELGQFWLVAFSHLLCTQHCALVDTGYNRGRGRAGDRNGFAAFMSRHTFKSALALFFAHSWARRGCSGVACAQRGRACGTRHYGG